jgi:NAD kinase
MRRRPIVFSDNERFHLTVTRGNALLLVDGSAVEILGENMQITVKKAPFTADFPVREGRVFFDKIHKKLNQ